MGETYTAAGVDIAAGEEAVDRIRNHVRSTYRAEVVGDVGGFGGLFALAPDKYREPLLVSSTDTVGTKALVAAAADRLDTIGIDLVAMVVDDLAAQGAEPLFLLDCLSVGRLVPADVERIVAGVAEGCRQAGCALLGGEMAESAGLLRPGTFDLAGFGVGVVERTRLVTGERVSPGDRLLGLPSPGLRCNGYALAQRVLLERAGLSLEAPAWPGADVTLAEELLRPSVIYAPALVALGRAVDVRALAHVTGGGLAANLSRVLPATCDAVVNRGGWRVPRIFGEIQRLGDVHDDEMAKVFNLGIGMVAAVPAQDVSPAREVLATSGLDAVEIGEVVEGRGRVRLA